MDDFYKLEAAYRSMDNEARMRIIAIAQDFAGEWPRTEVEVKKERPSFLKLVTSGNKS